MRSGMSHGMGKMRFLDEKMEKPKMTKQLLTRIVKYFLPYWKQMMLALAVIIITSVLGIIPPILIKDIVDKALPEKSVKLLSIYILVSIGITVVMSLMQVWQSYINTWISKQIIFHMKNEMYLHMQNMSLRFFQRQSPGKY